jgi:F-type H+-transporting ATPase subunit b
MNIFLPIGWLQLSAIANLLAAEVAEAAEAVVGAEEGGFGLNLNLFETNLVNLLIVIGIVVYFGKGFFTKTLGARSQAIETALGEAQRRREETAKALAEQQQKLKQAQAEAAQIVAKAEGDAQAAAAAIAAKSAEDLVRMRETAAADVSSEEARIMGELRQRIAELAMQQAAAQLPGRLNASAQQSLIDRSISIIGGQS